MNIEYDIPSCRVHFYRDLVKNAKGDIETGRLHAYARIHLPLPLFVARIWARLHGVKAIKLKG